jgi:hypothetical protein
LKQYLYIIILLSGLFVGCNNNCCEQELLKDSLSVKGNQTPIARITNLPTKIQCETIINASGKSSIDPDGTIDKYYWTLDGENIGQMNDSQPNIELPCDDSIHKICLSVVDNKGLQSATNTCQAIKVMFSDRIIIQVDKKLPVAIIKKEKADENQYKFFCNDSYDTDVIDSDNKVNPIGKYNSIVKCEWSVTKYYIDSDDFIKHNDNSEIKWINVDSTIYKSIDLTLTVIDDDGQTNSTTQSYIIPEGLPL